MAISLDSWPEIRVSTPKGDAMLILSRKAWNELEYKIVVLVLSDDLGVLNEHVGLGKIRPFIKDLLERSNPSTGSWVHFCRFQANFCLSNSVEGTFEVTLPGWIQLNPKRP